MDSREPTNCIVIPHKYKCFAIFFKPKIRFFKELLTIKTDNTDLYCMVYLAPGPDVAYHKFIDGSCFTFAATVDGCYIYYDYKN